MRVKEFKLVKILNSNKYIIFADKIQIGHKLKKSDGEILLRFLKSWKGIK